MEHQSCCNWFFYRWLQVVGSWIQPLFLLAIRLFWGWAFLMSGLGKFMAIEKTTEFFAGVGIMWPAHSAYLVAGVEVVAGLLLMIGLISRFAAMLLSVVMIVALFTAHAEAVYGVVSDPGLLMAQQSITFLMVTLTVWCFGPGGLSLDRLIEKKHCCR